MSIEKKIKNYNPAINTSFKLEIPSLEVINYFVQSTELPAINAMAIRTDIRNHQAYVPANKIEYDPLTVNFIVDEDFRNQQELHLWMLRCQHGDSSLLADECRDISLHLLTSNKTSGRIVKFFKAFPTMISGIMLESGVVDPMPLMCSATFYYQYYEVI